MLLLAIVLYVPVAVVVNWQDWRRDKVFSRGWVRPWHVITYVIVWSVGGAVALCFAG